MLENSGTIRDIDTCILYYVAQHVLEQRVRDVDTETKLNLQHSDWKLVHNVKNQEKACYHSPVNRRKLRKVFDKYVPSVHHLVPLIVDYLGYDRVDVITVQGTATLEAVNEEKVNGIGYEGRCCGHCPVYAKRKGRAYEVDEQWVTMGNGQRVKHRINIGIPMDRNSAGSKFQRHAPFESKESDSVYVGAQKPRHILRSFD